MAGIDLGIATGVLATFLGSDPIVVGGTPEQKHHWMSRIADEALLWPTAPPSRRPAATWRADHQGRAGVNEDGTSPATTSPAASSGSATAAWPKSTPSWPLAPGGPSWFVVERMRRRFQQRQAGGQARHPRQQHGRALPGRCLCPADRLMGCVEGQGLAQAQAVFGYTR
jgi:alkylation response protein AidB-like acyl-CoA dehydrogenase